LDLTFFTVKIVYICLGFILLIFFLISGIYAFREKEKRAFLISLITAIMMPVPFFLVSGLQISYEPYLWFILFVILGLIILLIIPLQGKNFERQYPVRHIDERDTMFSRNELQPGTDRFKDYYINRPEYLKTDEKFRKRPGLLSSSASLYDSLTFASAEASFTTVGTLSELRNGSSCINQGAYNPKKLSRFLKEWGQKLGAVSVGITPMKDYHFYTHGGRRERYGIPVDNSHSFGIVFTVEMDHELISAAPAGAAVMESAREYLQSGVIATQIALTLRNLGFEAKSHIDGNYDLICPLVARDAGLGEIGRMGLLITPELGPRVRISVVTTNAALIADEPSYNNSVIDFCRICKKCANVCPTASIPLNDRKLTESGLRWQINQESCFTYWCQTGTDCGRCMAVCPYSHPSNKFHDFIRAAISRNFLFRRMAILMDDLFYSKKPSPKKIPDWID
jgi:reductive dehalogenase